MPKKKNKHKQPQKQLSEAAYMKSGRARKLPIHECLVNSNWEESGMAAITVSRTHVNGNISFASYLVDLYCLGVKDAWFRVNIFAFEYEQYLERLAENFDMTKADYANVHNIIYGAVAFAEDYGISPVQEFAVAKMMLEEDTEEIPLIAYEYGVKGKPQLVIDADNPKLSFYLGKLEKHAGKGNYELVLQGDFSEDEDDYDDYDEEEEVRYVDFQTFSAKDWEEFILETDPEELLLRRWEAFYMYKKVIAAETISNPEFDVRNIPITYEPIEDEKSDVEGNETRAIYEAITFDENSPEDLRRILARVKDAIEKWPEKPIFHNYLFNVYRKLNEDEKEKETVRNLIKAFPDYLFGKLNYAELLINEGRFDEVADIFDNQLHLRLAFPNRDVFHISEFVSFNTIMCLYSMEKGDLNAAFGYRRMLDEVDIPEHMKTNEELFFEVDISAIMAIKAVLIEAQQDKSKREEMIAALVA